MHMDAVIKSLGQRNFKVPQAHKAITIPLPKAELNSHGKRINAGRETRNGEKIEKQ